MKYLLPIGLFIAGLSIGYIVGDQVSFDSTSDEITNEEPQLVTEVVHDTIIKTEVVEVEPTIIEVDSMKLVLDSTNVWEDTLLVENPVDSSEEDIAINREKLLWTVRLPINYIESEKEEEDSLVKEMMGIEEVKNKMIFVEFWSSPLNYEGYKLSKNKLILYGMSPKLEYKFYRKDAESFLACQDVYYILRETEVFLSYSEVPKRRVFND